MSIEKLKAVAHFIISECRNAPEQLGATRLNKVIWFADVISFQTEGLSITGEAYVKRQYGPVPRHILQALRSLENDGSISIREPEVEYEVRRFYLLRSPASQALSEGERRILQDVLNAILGITANKISEMTHDQIWEAASAGEEIPLEATLVAIPGEITEDIQMWAKGVVANANRTAGA